MSKSNSNTLFTTIELSIIGYMIETDKASCNEIAKATDQSIQTVSYNLTKLLAKGIIIRDFDEKTFIIQPLLKNKNAIKKFESFISSLFNEHIEDIIFDSEDLDMENPEIVVENTILTFNLINMSKIIDIIVSQNGFE